MSAEAPARPRLIYFDGRGHGERVRYALAGAGFMWDEVLLKQPGDMDAARPSCLFGQVPLLEMDGLKLVQSWAMVRYIAAKAQQGQQLSAGDAWKADACVEQVRDWYTQAGFGGLGWSPDREGELATVRAAAARHLPHFEAVLAGSSGTYLLGADPCWADYQLLLALDYSIEVLGEGCMEGSPRCLALRSSLRATPHMQAFYASPHCKGLVDQRYKDEVMAAMSPKP